MLELRRDVYLDDNLHLLPDVAKRFQNALKAAKQAAFQGFIDPQVTEERRQRLPCCPVAEFVQDELERIAAAREEHLCQCQIADQAGLPQPDLDNFMPEQIWTKLATISD